ncbi:hypothetical protein EMIT0210MI2_10782 [Priestia megaterium]
MFTKKSYSSHQSYLKASHVNDKIVEKYLFLMFIKPYFAATL